MDTQKSQLSANGNQFNPDFSKNEILSKLPIDNTPFNLIKSNNGSFIALGEFRLSNYGSNPENDLNDQEMAEELMEIDKWNIILNLITIATGFALEQHSQTKMQ